MDTLVLYDLCAMSRVSVITVLVIACDSFKNQRKHKLGGGFKYFLFSPLFGEDSHFD